MKLTRPKTEEELQHLEAAGIIRAARFVTNYAKMHEPITCETIFEIHRNIFCEAWLEIAGHLRREQIDITDSQHRPPHQDTVFELVRAADKELQERLQGLISVESYFLSDESEMTDEVSSAIQKIIATAAWLHHKIVHVHFFREGNGRTARLAANLVLQRFGLVGISIKIERENKNRYRAALAQADQHEDFEPLETLIFEGLIERYDGVPMHYLKN